MSDREQPPMKLRRFACLIALAFPLVASAADTTAVTFYVQLIRGTDDSKPPSADAKPAGAQVTRRLQMFKWKNYWEISRKTVAVNPGGKTRQPLAPQREVEIAVGATNDMTISIYADGKLARKRKQPVTTPFYISGGDKEGNQSWFIVVRRDKPPDTFVTNSYSFVR